MTFNELQLHHQPCLSEILVLALMIDNPFPNRKSLKRADESKLVGASVGRQEMIGDLANRDSFQPDKISGNESYYSFGARFNGFLYLRERRLD